MMFDLDDINDGYRTVIRFTYDQYDDEGNPIARVERVLRDDQAEFLPSILNCFLLFLQGMTYTYVDDVVAFSDKGTEYSAEDGF